MANVLVNDASLADIADAIREKNGTEETYKPAEMGAAVRAIESGGGVDYLEKRISGEVGLYEYYSENIVKLRNSAFVNDINLLSINLPNCESIGDAAFKYCSKLKKVELPKLKTVSGTNGHFQGSAIEECRFPSLNNTSNYPVFDTSQSLTKAILDSPKAVISVGFHTCSSLKTVIIYRQDTIVTLANVNAFTATPIVSGTGYIYVPKALIETYKTATNWVTYANQFRALEDYTVDGTTTGALDESKIAA